MWAATMVDCRARWHTRWLSLAGDWGNRLTGSGLGGPVQAMVDAARPLAPLVVHLLWFLQPALMLYGRGEAAAALADLLEPPAPPQLPPSAPAEPSGDR